ncbi:hypothetical protein [Tropicibacter naphthalenivorans]|uniref:Uncharacterized protein n=1 Tax=Tropicibacter naphthalenivorans TaxID=441103 RepID=A0A0P1GLI2_9RHOB|nr:hypothetical protein [Tropicibacter naphthalenivorans]CUH76250.1 hypothetical protein TRN7648_00854 [Tropicibacter naphthalenivorans]SMC39176.1 hypothetical protein SAMN04488093_10129 [Tropicibacter naphthalenivorans]
MTALMPATQIVHHLEEVSDLRAEEAARQGFLEWALTLPLDASPAMEARKALGQLAPECPHSRAAGAFLDMLRQAARACAMAPVRRGGRSRRVLH